MFQAPSKTTVYAAPAEPIDIDQRYLFKLVRLEDEGVSKFADPAKGETFHNIRWHFRIAPANDPTNPILTTDDEAWEHVEWTTSKTGKNPKSGIVAKARAWIEAFVGHPVDDEDITEDIDRLILDKIASGLFENKEMTSAQTGEVYTRLRILRLSPYKAKPETRPAAKQERETTPAF